MSHQSPKTKQRGVALISAFMVLGLLAVASTAYINGSTHSVRMSYRQQQVLTTTHLCEAGIQAITLDLWTPFKTTQRFTDMDSRLSNASTSAPKDAMLSTIPGVGTYSVGVISYQTVPGDAYSRLVTVRSVGWYDSNGNQLLDRGEARKTIDVTIEFQLARSPVFDYAYFVNNYGWMDGFGQSDLVVNGDMRANGDFSFTNGSPTVNGSVYACNNSKLSSNPVGLINIGPVKQSTSSYIQSVANNSRARRGYDSGIFGTKGTAAYEQNRDFVFDSDGSIVTGRTSGATLNDASGSKAWSRLSAGQSATSTNLDVTPTKEVIMPDLSNMAQYMTLASSYVDTKKTYSDGTTNPNYGKGAYVQIWTTIDSSGTQGYKTITTNGQLTGSAIIIGTKDHPIIVHGPVTFSQDAVIKGTVSGQGTIYAGRNVHIVGSVTYANPPDFRGSDPSKIDASNEKKDSLGLAASASVIMGDTSQFGFYPLYYMQPPFTKDRTDANGNVIPAYNATQTDATGFKKYQSTVGDAAIHSVASGINQIDAVMYTNFVGGGNLGTSGGGVTLNGSIISKDEAMVTWSLPIVQNYDNRIRERSVSNTPLIDLQLPRSPVILTSVFQDMGFGNGYESSKPASTTTTAPSSDASSPNRNVGNSALSSLVSAIKNLISGATAPKSATAKPSTSNQNAQGDNAQ